jgi:radical SAM superfamily enzyme YgiQ (UPF0313 family)
MKTLLISINAKYIHTNNAVRLLKANSDFDIDIFEYTIKDNIKDIIEDIKTYAPDILGFSVYIWNVEIVKEIVLSLSLPNTTIILGGPEVSYETSHFMNTLPIDYIISGEGELSFNSLLHSIKDNTSKNTLPNLTYRENNKIKHTPLLEIEDLNTVTLPYYFEEDIPHIKNKISYIESSRGCPYKCSYCLSSLEKGVRFFDIEKVKEAILYLMNHGSKTIKFLDRTFNANKKTLELMKFIIDHNNNQTVFQFEITGDILDPKIIEYLNNNAPKGLFRFEIGIQSINYETNYLVDRFQNTEKLFQNIKMIQDKNIIDLHLDLIAGLPKEDLESFKNTFNTVFKLNAKELQLGFLKMLRGTKIRLEADKYNYLYQQTSPYQIISNDFLTEQEIDQIHQVEHMLEIYHNKGYFKEEMAKILTSKDNPFDFLLKISTHYKTNNYSLSHYQVEDVYKRVMPLLNQEEQYNILKDYLRRSKVKPKIFFNVVSKEERKTLYERLSIKHGIQERKLYKNSITIENNKEYYTVLYHDLTHTVFQTKKEE